MEKHVGKIMMVAVALIFAVVVMGASECDGTTDTPVSASGVSKATVHVKTDADGLTVEQKNISKRLEMDNTPGSIKHLYVISSYSGQVIIYSTVQGKVTSSGKRLTPTEVASNAGEFNRGIPVDIGGETYRTSEVLQDDGSYGSSDPYVFWWDTKGVYHQHYVSGGQIIHVSDQPLSVKSIIINMEIAGAPSGLLAETPVPTEKTN